MCDYVALFYPMITTGSQQLKENVDQHSTLRKTSLVNTNNCDCFFLLDNNYNKTKARENMIYIVQEFSQPMRWNRGRV
jgi:hypothetical protein